MMSGFPTLTEPDRPENSIGRFMDTAESWSTWSLRETNAGHVFHSPFPFSNPSTRGLSGPLSGASPFPLGVAPAQAGLRTRGGESPKWPTLSTHNPDLSTRIGELLGPTCYPAYLDLVDGQSLAETPNVAGDTFGSSSRAPHNDLSRTRISEPSTTKRRRTQDRSKPSYGCPMAKVDPEWYETIFNPCTHRQGLGADVKRVREHLDSYHSPKHRCPNCRQKFKGAKAEQNYKAHMKTNDCKAIDSESLPHMFTEEQEAAFRAVKDETMTGEDLWRRYFRALFPYRQDHDSISPHYDYVTLTHQIPSYPAPASQFESPCYKAPQIETRSGNAEQGQKLLPDLTDNLSSVTSEANWAMPSLIENGNANIDAASSAAAALSADSPAIKLLLDPSRCPQEPEFMMSDSDFDSGLASGELLGNEMDSNDIDLMRSIKTFPNVLYGLEGR